MKHATTEMQDRNVCEITNAKKKNKFHKNLEKREEYYTEPYKY